MGATKAQSEEPTGIRLILFRSYGYWLQGFGFVSLPLQIIGFSTAIYLAIKDILPFGYPQYMVFVLGFGVPSIMGFGWTIYHKTHFYAQQQSIQNYNSPYAHWKINPIETPIWLTYRALATDLNRLELVKMIEEILERNGVKYK